MYFVQVLLVIIGLNLISCSPGPDPFLKFSTPTPPEVISACKQENPNLSDSECDLRQCFSNEFVLLAMEKLTVDMDDAFKKINLRYFIESGILLGAYRLRAPLPWDDDVDVSAMARDFEPNRAAFEREVRKKGYRITELWGDFNNAGRGMFGGHMPMLEISFTKEGWESFVLNVDPNLSRRDVTRLGYEYELHGRTPRYEIILYDDNNGVSKTRVKSLNDMMGDRVLHTTLLVPADGSAQPTIKFLGHDLPAPANTDGFLQVLYPYPNIKFDFVMNAAFHTGRCTQKIRFKDIRSHKPVLDYFRAYLKSVFGTRFTGFDPELEIP